MLLLAAAAAAAAYFSAVYAVFHYSRKRWGWCQICDHQVAEINVFASIRRRDLVGGGLNPQTSDILNINHTSVIHYIASCMWFVFYKWFWSCHFLERIDADFDAGIGDGDQCTSEHRWPCLTSSCCCRTGQRRWFKNTWCWRDSKEVWWNEQTLASHWTQNAQG